MQESYLQARKMEDTHVDSKPLTHMVIITCKIREKKCSICYFLTKKQSNGGLYFQNSPLRVKVLNHQDPMFVSVHPQARNTHIDASHIDHLTHAED